MGKSVSFASIREAVRVRHDLPTAFSDAPPSFVSLSAVNALINSSVRAFYAMLAECYGDSYFETATAITTQPGDDLSSLPTNCTKVLGLIWLRSAGQPVTLRRADVRDLGVAYEAARPWTQAAPVFRLQGSAIRWLPAPDAAHTVHCVHIAMPGDLVNDTDSFDSGSGWDEWVINDVCVKIASKEEKDGTRYLQERADWERRIRAQAPDRDEGQALQLGGSGAGWESSWSRRDRMTFGDW